MSNIQQGKIDWSDLVYTSDNKEIARFSLTRGDVLFNRTNSAELVGKTALYDRDRPAIFAGYLIKISCKASLSPAFLTFFLNGPEAREYFNQVRSDGVNQSNINAKKLADLRLRIPSLEEQIEIVQRLDRKLAWADAMLNHVDASEKLLERLKVGIVAKGFRGELTSLEPSDEPVDLLLAHLTAETDETRAARLEADRAFLLNEIVGEPWSGGQMAHKRNEVSGKHLRDLLVALGGAASAADLWAQSALPIEDFYKQLRDEVVAGQLEEGPEKGSLVAIDAA